jgi:hypothetical protein
MISAPMQDVLRALLDLQEVDRDLFRVQQELRRLPVERDARQAELDRIAAQGSEKRAQAKLLRVRIKELEDQATIARQRQRKVEHELGQARADVQLLAYYEHQIKSLRREVSNDEEEGLRLLEQAEALDSEASQIEARHAEARANFAALSANIEREMAVAEERRAKLAAERARRVGDSVPPEALATYERLLQSREGVALSLLDGRQCQTCFMDVPPNLVIRIQRARELVPCPSCDRILFLPS